jgi:hypothetical protein
MRIDAKTLLRYSDVNPDQEKAKMTNPQTGARKDEHIRINLEEDVSFDQVTTGLERYRFTHQALPECNLTDVDTTTHFLNRRLAFPVLISSMTGGTERTGNINHILAEVAQATGIGMGLGSMRTVLENPQVLTTFQVRRYAPDILLLANLGAVQLNYGYGPDACRRLVDLVEADGLFLHLNPLQEALQPEGNTRFAGIVRQIEAVCRALEVPVIVKEVGWGLSAPEAPPGARSKCTGDRMLCSVRWQRRSATGVFPRRRLYGMCAGSRRTFHSSPVAGYAQAWTSPKPWRSGRTSPRWQQGYSRRQ